VSQWAPNPAPGVEVSIHSDSGLHGRAMRVDFDFHGHQGYWIVHRNVSLDLPMNYEFNFALRGTAPVNNLEFKLVDGTGANVWWSRKLNYDFSAQWRTLARQKRQICFAWGQSTGNDLHHVAAIEFAVSTGSGGKGSVWIDDLSLAALRRESPFDAIERAASNPLVGTWESDMPNGGVGAKLDFAADGSFASTIALMGSFDYKRTKDHLIYTLNTNGRPEDHTIPTRIHRDTLFQTGSIEKGRSLIGRDVTMKRSRPASAGDDVIAGDWEDVDYPEYVRFDETGKAEYRAVTKSCSGTWTAANGQLTIDMNGEISKRDYSIENDVLTVRSPVRVLSFNRRLPSRR
jgi:hypothetical protein